MKKCLISIALIAISVSACTSNINSTKGTNIKPNAEMLQIKDIEGYGMETDYSGKNIGLAEPVIAAFNSIGPSNRIKTITAIQAPIIANRLYDVNNLNTVEKARLEEKVKQEFARNSKYYPN